jgi:hypothetical protein
VHLEQSKRDANAVDARAEKTPSLNIAVKARVFAAGNGQGIEQADPPAVETRPRFVHAVSASDRRASAIERLYFSP